MCSDNQPQTGCRALVMSFSLKVSLTVFKMSPLCSQVTSLTTLKISPHCLRNVSPLYSLYPPPPLYSRYDPNLIHSSDSFLFYCFHATSVPEIQKNQIWMKMISTNLNVVFYEVTIGKTPDRSHHFPMSSTHLQ